MWCVQSAFYFYIFVLRQVKSILWWLAHFTGYRVKCEVWSLQCGVCTVECSVLSVKFWVYIVECEVLSVKCWVCSIECEVLSVQCWVWGVECVVVSVKCWVWTVEWVVLSVKCWVWSVECAVLSVNGWLCSVECAVLSVQCWVLSRVGVRWNVVKVRLERGCLLLTWASHRCNWIPQGRRMSLSLSYLIMHPPGKMFTDWASPWYLGGYHESGSWGCPQGLFQLEAWLF